MSNTVIKIENLSKSYLLKHQQTERYSTLSETLVKKTRSVFNSKNSSNKTVEEFWALNDVSFDVKQGERVGIIGRNGAGKSTLLKILSRIVAPTKGRITIDGRVASLLEVGTGFHPELSGRENIFLNGSILGMNKQEIQRKFDEIVAFSEVERFLDTPVKRYSSGMYVRLAFAVAAHLEPEILIVDEVLAVGDAEFQRKCLGKMKDVSGEGRTVLFVSHNMAAIQNLCDKAVYMKRGEVQMIGDSEKVISTYLKGSSANAEMNLADRNDRSGNSAIRFSSVELKDTSGNILAAFQSGKDAVLNLKFDRIKGKEIKNLHIAVAFDDEFGQRISHMNNEITNEIFNSIPDDCNEVEVHIPRFPFKHGLYTFSLYATVNGELADWLNEAGTIDVESGDFYNTGKQLPDGQGKFLFQYNFKLPSKF
ncbi:MAG: Teichoic-acid-transporting ATPase [Bacteroidetes bacterium]|jgi:lipopolysaccharide transport system ATP-binding protein|nr:Teichoic-acid-transporting ATPase [Bacteroidota bacterium]